MNGWTKTDPKHGVAIHRGTDVVPADDRYHLLVDGEIVFSTRGEAAVLVEYEAVREERMSKGRDQLRREREAADLRSHRSESWAAKFARDTRKGGRGIGRR